MRVLGVHPGPLLYTKIFLKLEPLGLELVADAVRRAGHEVALIDLQVEGHGDYFRTLRETRPDVIAFSCNYLANVPEVVDLAKGAKETLGDVFVVVGGHSASFIAADILRHGDGAIDCVLRGEGEAGIVELLAAVESGDDVSAVAGAVTADGHGPPARFVENLNLHRPARDLLRHRRKYYIGSLDPAASIEFSRGCPWDCTFCSAWTFYGRSYRMYDVEVCVEELERIREPGIFIVDDVAFIHRRQGLAIGEAIARRGLKKEFYLETRADVLLRNKEVFELWSTLGLKYMFIGLEAIDEEGLKHFRKRVSVDKNFEALEFARSLGITVAINLIAEPDWDRERFRIIREWCAEIPEVVNISVNTPYPGTESWVREVDELTTLDYRLFDIQHAVMPTRLPLAEFYRELVETQRVLARKHLGWRTMLRVSKRVLRLLAHGQTNFLKMLYKFDSVYDDRKLLQDHEQALRYRLTAPPVRAALSKTRELYIHTPAGRKARQIDDATEDFVENTRMGTSV